MTAMAVGNAAKEGVGSRWRHLAGLVHRPSTFFPDDLRTSAGRAIMATLGGLCVLAALIWITGWIATGRTQASLAAHAHSAAALHAAMLRSELEKYRSLPFMLAEDAEVREALGSGDPARLDTLNRKLERVRDQTRAAVVYLLNTQGVAIAASNWRSVDSFVGTNYNYRHYFREALQGKVPEDFALGAVSKHPGLFLARAVATDGRVLGVVVVKVEFDGLESEWRKSEGPAFVTEAHGVVLVTSVKDWRFKTLGSMDAAERMKLRASHQFGTVDLQPLPLAPTGERMFIEKTKGGSVEYIEATTPAPVAGWSVHVLARSGPAVAAAVMIARLAALSLGVLFALAIWIFFRSRARSRQRAAGQQRIQAELEARVAERTQALRIANERLILEIEERQCAETSRQAMQDELVQANKLAMLGQIAAGVAHEINQPVAAIRSFADNAVLLLDRHNLDETRTNLTTITALTERIGEITGELRAVSRKTSRDVAAVPLGTAIAGALLLVGHRVREQGVRIVREGIEELHVVAQRVRLEQVLLNLLQNALDALGHTSAGLIRLTVDCVDGQVRISIADNGPGVSPEVKQGLFTPFRSNKPNGLGLGLVISRDLVTEFGGDLTHEESDTGALFVITLRKAE
jgi:two-component system, NtrC family, C4-dicarboxylate transport sensor histidine kinase DctB